MASWGEPAEEVKLFETEIANELDTLCLPPPEPPRWAPLIEGC